MEPLNELWIPPTNRELLEKLYSMVKDPYSTTVISEALSRMIVKRELERIDGLMILADLSRLYAGAAIAMLRVTFHLQDEFPHWRQFRDDVKQELHSRGLDPVILMMGLLQ
jgi:hypothetical protein